MHDMEWRFSIPEAEDTARLAPYFCLRPCKACESGYLDYFLWADYYRVRYMTVKDEALLIVMKNDREYFAALPYCKEEHLPEYFEVLRVFFNDVLEQPFKIYLADEEGVRALGLFDNADYYVREEEDFRDYLYDAQELKTLPGRKFQKKRNLINKFLKDYEGRWAYRTLGCDDRDEVIAFLDRWFPAHGDEASDGAASLTSEREGLVRILADCCSMCYRIGAVTIDDRIEAISIGTYNPVEEMAVVSVEKADPGIPGLYQLINRDFLVHAFPEARLVNREDDVGLAGVRQAKMSYHPVGFEKKYMVVQKEFRGRRVDLTDPYEEEVSHYQNQA